MVTSLNSAGFCGFISNTTHDVDAHSHFPDSPDFADGSKYTHDEWFRLQLYRFVFLNKDTLSASELWRQCSEFIDSTNCSWPPHKVRNEYYRGLKDKAKTDTTFTPPEIAWNDKDHQIVIAKEIADKLAWRNHPEV